MVDKKTKKYSHLVFPLFLILLLFLSVFFFAKYWSKFESKEAFELWLGAWGDKAPFIFILIQFIQVVVFVLPGEIPQIAGGYVFGFMNGYLLSNIGIISGALFNYSVGRLFGADFIKRIVNKENFERFEYLVSSRNIFIPLFILFVIPGIPKDALCYIAGLTSIRLLPFLLISIVGRAPGILMSTVFGDAAAEKNWILLSAMALLTLIMILAAILFNKRKSAK